MIAPPARPRSPWQWLYGTAHRLRRRWWAKRSRRLPRPVISVGNLSWGGSGKTPLVAAIAGHLRDRGLAVAILSRGYKRQSRGVLVVSTGEGPLLGPLVAGDEPVLLAGEVPGVGVVVGSSRFEAGRHALERLDPRPDVFVLDDGFSHLELARDLDLLCFPAADPLAGGRLPPGGRLREPLASSERADAALLTGAGDEGAAGLAEALAPFGFRGRAFASRSDSGEARSERHEPLPPGCRVLLVSAIGRPAAFERAAAELPVEVVGKLAFADHHGYPAASLRRIEGEYERLQADYVLTTTKDEVKLLGRLAAPLAALPVVAVPEPAFWQWLDERVDELRAAAL